VVSIEEETKHVSMGRPHLVVLGAGASVAACPNGDKNGKHLPVMDNFIEMLGLGLELSAAGVNYRTGNFEELYGDLSQGGDHRDLVKTIDEKVRAYFERLELPDHPTIYDHLVLSLREKDVIASFNWDPFLFQAFKRNYGKARLPHVVYLHGNVWIGYCVQDRTKGKVGAWCSRCGELFIPSRLVYPIKQKHYSADPYLSGEWRTFEDGLANAYILTIFGYSAPKSDVDAVRLMKNAWNGLSKRSLEEIEIIDTKNDGDLRVTWREFIYSHHYRTEKDFYSSWMAKHPRRTCEAMWNRLMEIQVVSENPIPRNASFESLWEWCQALVEAEAGRE
jgi:hypothetical protein